MTWWMELIRTGVLVGFGVGAVLAGMAMGRRR